MRHNNVCWMIGEMTAFMHFGTKCMFQLQQFAQKIEFCQILIPRMDYISAGLFRTSGRLWMKAFEKCNLDRFFFFLSEFWRWNTLKGWKYVNVSILKQSLSLWPNNSVFISKNHQLLHKELISQSDGNSSMHWARCDEDDFVKFTLSITMGAEEDSRGFECGCWYQI